MRKTIKSFLTKDIHPKGKNPLYQFNYEKIRRTVEPELIPYEIEILETQVQEYRDSQNESLQNAIPRIELCSILHIFSINKNKHFSWCPYEEWRDALDLEKENQADIDLHE